jgi:hypothetical protein
MTRYPFGRPLRGLINKSPPSCNSARVLKTVASANTRNCATVTSRGLQNVRGRARRRKRSVLANDFRQITSLDIHEDEIVPALVRAGVERGGHVGMHDFRRGFDFEMKPLDGPGRAQGAMTLRATRRFMRR